MHDLLPVRGTRPGAMIRPGAGGAGGAGGAAAAACLAVTLGAEAALELVHVLQVAEVAARSGEVHDGTGDRAMPVQTTARYMPVPRSTLEAATDVAATEQDAQDHQDRGEPGWRRGR